MTGFWAVTPDGQHLRAYSGHKQYFKSPCAQLSLVTECRLYRRFWCTEFSNEINVYQDEMLVILRTIGTLLWSGASLHDPSRASENLCMWWDVFVCPLLFLLQEGECLILTKSSDRFWCIICFSPVRNSTKACYRAQRSVQASFAEKSTLPCSLSFLTIIWKHSHRLVRITTSIMMLKATGIPFRGLL